MQNTSTAGTRVTVRNPMPEGIRSRSRPSRNGIRTRTWKELVWSFGTLAAGKSKTIELTLRPKKDAMDVKNLAYVRFEHGEAVTTRFNKPAVQITKIAPKQTVRDEQYVVRIAVDNTGKVPAEKLRMAENVPASAEVEPITKGGATHGAAAGAAVGVGDPELMPGERKVIEYRVTAREAKDVFTLTNLSAEKGIQDKAESTTHVLVPGLTVKLTGRRERRGRPRRVGEVRDHGAERRHAAEHERPGDRHAPGGLKPTMKTEGGHSSRRDRVDDSAARSGRGADVPVRGEGQEHRPPRGGRLGGRCAAASAADELATLFQGTAALVWESVPNPVALAVGKQGTFTIKVRNNGGEAARNVRVEVDLPDAVSVVQITPNVRPTGSKLAFAAEMVAAYGETVYTITYEAPGVRAGVVPPAMTADCLGDQPMQTEKAVEITGGG